MMVTVTVLIWMMKTMMMVMMALMLHRVVVCGDDGDCRAVAMMRRTVTVTRTCRFTPNPEGHLSFGGMPANTPRVESIPTTNVSYCIIYCADARATPVQAEWPNDLDCRR